VKGEGSKHLPDGLIESVDSSWVLGDEGDGTERGRDARRREEGRKLRSESSEEVVEGLLPGSNQSEKKVRM